MDFRFCNAHVNREKLVDKNLNPRSDLSIFHHWCQIAIHIIQMILWNLRESPKDLAFRLISPGIWALRGLANSTVFIGQSRRCWSTSFTFGVIFRFDCLNISRSEYIRLLSKRELTVRQFYGDNCHRFCEHIIKYLMKATGKKKKQEHWHSNSDYSNLRLWACPL